MWNINHLGVYILDKDRNSCSCFKDSNTKRRMGHSIRNVFTLSLPPWILLAKDSVFFPFKMWKDRKIFINNWWWKCYYCTNTWKNFISHAEINVIPKYILKKIFPLTKYWNKQINVETENQNSVANSSALSAKLTKVR